jgi:ABC-type uncharacterized transport system permease subunit
MTTITTTTWDDLNEVIPWILSLFLFVIVPVVMKVSEAVRNQDMTLSLKDRLMLSKSILGQCLTMCKKVCA